MNITISLALSLVLGAGGHLLVKEGVSRAGSGLWALLHPAVIAGVTCYFLSMLAWLPFLASKPVAQAVPVAGITYMLVALGAGILSGQWLTVHQWVGVALIGGGVWLLGK
ncbi:hypothetical protein [Desulforamulus ruminis]|uniref:EamA domain-containing protein n=1 Tax=Desulforamulus ruminis (strain ATCC 23193 / DSM 2154 / NCIMB 8452 / DL) TaxID=696281 RepID=F6DQ18_DESRL|nr:hypothetical protein [Desulforamulus ruminis]AEG61962.1 hypothetical protein Desru_3762 [Desulforamulus ruminis DSM 2154]